MLSDLLSYFLGVRQFVPRSLRLDLAPRVLSSPSKPTTTQRHFLGATSVVAHYGEPSAPRLRMGSLGCAVQQSSPRTLTLEPLIAEKCAPVRAAVPYDSTEVCVVKLCLLCSAVEQCLPRAVSTTSRICTAYRRAHVEPDISPLPVAPRCEPAPRRSRSCAPTSSGSCE